MTRTETYERPLNKECGISRFWVTSLNRGRSLCMVFDILFVVCMFPLNKECGISRFWVTSLNRGRSLCMVFDILFVVSM